jgi:uncharacterized protein GlcG (DUF336 family)
MTKVKKLEHADATRLVRSIVAAASADGGPPVTVGVAGADGALMALERMDGAPALGVNVIIAKLFTAVAGLKDTIERMGKGVDPSDYNDARITTFGGGVVLRDGPHVYGAIAVTGRPPEKDHELADAARRSLDA